MRGETLDVGPPGTLITVTLSRPEQGNAINRTMLRELDAALAQAENCAICHAVVLQGGDGVFCDGMDLTETTVESAAFLALLRRFTLSPKVIVAAVDGRVTGGGVGLAAASDLVVATPRSYFSLPEALLGLLPACVLPYLIRRIGFQRAYRMALSTQPVAADQALAWTLVDEVGENPGETVRRLLRRSAQVHPETIGALKRYAGELAAIDSTTEQRAAAELSRLLETPQAQAAIAAMRQRRRPAAGGRGDG
nr:enoyl-CoA hydratase-related protein [uncultured Rhodopila sp.]